MKLLQESNAISAAKKDAEIARLTRESDELRAQNKKTLEEVTRLKQHNQSITEEADKLRNEIASLLVPIQNSKPQPKDFLAHLLDHPDNQKLPFIKDIKDKIPNLEKRMGKKVNEHLGFWGDLKD